MAESFSFDVVSDFDRQELVNTLDQVKREISQRYDLKGTDTSVDLDKENISGMGKTIREAERSAAEKFLNKYKKMNNINKN